MDDPILNTYLSPWVSGLMVSIMTFGKLCSGAKSLGWKHSNEIFENDFENLGVGSYSIDGFQNVF
jgi:hypothetical protein